MDKNPLSGLLFNRMCKKRTKISAKQPQRNEVYPKNNLGFFEPLRERSPVNPGGVNKDRGD